MTKQHLFDLMLMVFPFPFVNKFAKAIFFRLDTIEIVSGISGFFKIFTDKYCILI